MAVKPAFRRSFKSRRCIMLMSGFFEWRHNREDKKIVKQPYFITRQDKKLMAVAAIWDNFKPEPHTYIPCCCVLTSPANELVSSLHDRIPWILSEAQQKAWLEQKEFESADLEEIMHQNQAISLDCYPVTPSANSVLYKEKDAIKPLKKKI